jgi:hypothetical protein
MTKACAERAFRIGRVLTILQARPNGGYGGNGVHNGGTEQTETKRRREATEGTERQNSKNQNVNLLRAEILDQIVCAGPLSADDIGTTARRFKTLLVERALGWRADPSPRLPCRGARARHESSERHEPAGGTTSRSRSPDGLKDMPKTLDASYPRMASRLLGVWGLGLGVGVGVGVGGWGLGVGGWGLGLGLGFGFWVLS